MDTHSSERDTMRKALTILATALSLTATSLQAQVLNSTSRGQIGETTGVHYTNFVAGRGAFEVTDVFKNFWLFRKYSG